MADGKEIYTKAETYEKKRNSSKNYCIQQNLEVTGSSFVFDVSD